MKKVLALVLMAAMLVSSSALAADIVWCGWSGEEASTKPAIEMMINTWNEGNADSQVSWVGWPWAETLQQLIIRSSGSEAIDVAQVDSTMFVALLEADLIEPLTNVIDEAWLKENFPESALKFGQKDGVQYGMPWTTASIGMTYNPTLLAAAGVEKIPATIEEFEAALAALHAYDQDIIPYAVSTKDTTATADFIPWLWTFGGSIFDAEGKCNLGSPEAIACLTWYKKLADQGYIKANMSRFDARQLYGLKRVGFYDDAIMARSIAASNGIAEDELDATILPTLRPVLNEGDTPRSTMWGHLLVVLKNSKQKETGAEFVKHVVSKEISLKYFELCDMLPVMNEAIADEQVTGNAWANAWSQITEYGADSELKYLTESTELSTIISEELQAVIIGEKTPEEASASMVTRFGAVL